MFKKFFTDKPIEYEDVSSKGLDEQIKSFDILGTQDYAKALADFIKECDTPMTVGIQGDWGIGKTSIMNMIKSYLSAAHGKEYGLIWFNTWHYSLFNEDEYLSIAIINALLESIKREFNISDDDDSLKKAQSAALKVIKKVKFEAFGLSLSAKDFEEKSVEDNLGYADTASIMLEFRSDFKKLIKNIKQNYKKNGKPIERIVFFIDDLDRVKPLKALETLESLKNFLDVEDCIFVLAIDYEVIQFGMAEKLGHDLQKSSGKSFFDKIIQLPFTMPSSSYRLGEYIKELLANANFKIKQEDIKFYEDITTCTVGRNPRSVKRVINFVRLIRIIRNNHSNRETKDSEHQRKILYSLLCMQVAWPELFSYFVKHPTSDTVKNIENWEFLDTIPHINKLYERTSDIEQLKSNISAFFDLLFNLLDADGNGTISTEELKPVWNVLKIAKLTAVNVSEFLQPLDIFFKNMNSNDKTNNYKVIKDLFNHSKWGSGKITYKMSGKRYVTMVYNRRQVGTLVTLKSQPFLFRLDIDDEYLTTIFKEHDSEIILDDIISTITDASLTGFGDTIINIQEVLKLDKMSIPFMNKLYETILLKMKSI